MEAASSLGGGAKLQIPTEACSFFGQEKPLYQSHDACTSKDLLPLYMLLQAPALVRRNWRMMLPRLQLLRTSRENQGQQQGLERLTYIYPLHHVASRRNSALPDGSGWDTTDKPTFSLRAREQE